MKKLLLILAIGAFVACNDSGTEEGTGADTTTTTPSTLDTSSVVTPGTDTTGVGTGTDTTGTGRTGDTTRPQ
jgi:hypothetical protein